MCGERPEGDENQEGIDASAGLITRPATSDRCTDQDPEGDVDERRGRRGNSAAARSTNDRRVRAIDEVDRPGSGRQTPEGESRTW